MTKRSRPTTLSSWSFRRQKARPPQGQPLPPSRLGLSGPGAPFSRLIVLSPSPQGTAGCHLSPARCRSPRWMPTAALQGFCSDLTQMLSMDRLATRPKHSVRRPSPLHPPVQRWWRPRSSCRVGRSRQTGPGSQGSQPPRHPAQKCPEASSTEMGLCCPLLEGGRC